MNNEGDEKEEIVKTLLVGAAGVGKSTMCLHHADKVFY